MIELLIVLAMIGVLAALLMPNALKAIQRARQKGTLKDISTLSGYIVDHTSDRGSAPGWDGDDITESCSFYSDLVPMYAKAIPLSDKWGNGYVVYSGPSWNRTWLGMQASHNSVSEFVIGSPGRNTTFSFKYNQTGALYYTIESMADFDNDLVNWNGQFVCAPRIALSSEMP